MARYPSNNVQRQRGAPAPKPRPDSRRTKGVPRPRPRNFELPPLPASVAKRAGIFALKHLAPKLVPYANAISLASDLYDLYNAYGGVYTWNRHKGWTRTCSGPKTDGGPPSSPLSGAQASSFPNCTGSVYLSVTPVPGKVGPVGSEAQFVSYYYRSPYGVITNAARGIDVKEQWVRQTGGSAASWLIPQQAMVPIPGTIVTPIVGPITSPFVVQIPMVRPQPGPEPAAEPDPAKKPDRQHDVERAPVYDVPPLKYPFIRVGENPGLHLQFPDTVIEIDPRPRPRPGPRPNPRPNPRPVPPPVINPPVPGPVPAPNPGPLAPPSGSVFKPGGDGRGVRFDRYPGRPADKQPKAKVQKKVNVVTYAPVLWTGLNTATEVKDFILAMHDALPKKLQLSKKDSMRHKVFYMLKHVDLWAQIDFAQAVENFINMQIGDMFAAIGSDQTKKIAQTLGKPTGVDRFFKTQQDLASEGIKNSYMDGDTYKYNNLSDFAPIVDINSENGTVTITQPTLGLNATYSYRR